MKKATLFLLVALAWSSAAFAQASLGPDAAVRLGDGGVIRFASTTMAVNYDETIPGGDALAIYLRNAPARYSDGVWTDPDTGKVATQTNVGDRPVVSGKGLSFDGSGSCRLWLPPAGATLPCTLSFCVKYGGRSDSYLYASAYSLNNAPGILVESTSGRMRVYYDTYWFYENSPVIASGSTYVYSFVFLQSGGSKIYRNGEVVSTAGGIYMQQNPTLGGYPTVDGYTWSGIMYSFAHHMRGLSAEEITTLTEIWLRHYR